MTNKLRHCPKSGISFYSEITKARLVVSLFLNKQSIFAHKFESNSRLQSFAEMKYLLDGQETNRLIFRKIKNSDFDDWVEFFKDPATSEHWVSEKESPEIECEKWYAYQFYRHENDKGGMNALVEKPSGKLIGHCGLLVQVVGGVTELEIAYSLLPGSWGKGYATEAAEKCKNFAFENNLSASLISIVSLTNIPSAKVALKNGMKIDKVTVYNGNSVNIFRIRKPRDK